MTRDEVMAKLSELTDPKTRSINSKNGVGENQFGVKMGSLRDLAKKLKANPALAEQLWATGNFDAMMLATLLMMPAALSVQDLDRMAGAIIYPQVADWFCTNVVKQNPRKEECREKWMASERELVSRIAWSLSTERVVKDSVGLDLSLLLDKIEAEMGAAPTNVQWTMNFCLGEIGINYPQYRARAIAIGEKIGAFRDYPTSKGCTSPYVPLWVAEMVRHQVR